MVFLIETRFVDFIGCNELGDWTPVAVFDGYSIHAVCAKMSEFAKENDGTDYRAKPISPLTIPHYRQELHNRYNADCYYNQ